MAVPLERVGRQRGGRAAPPRERVRPVHPGAAHLGPGECGRQGLRFGPAAPQDRQQRGLTVSRRLACQGGEDGVRAELDEDTHSVVPQRAQPVVEADGFSDVPGPVVG